LQICPRRALTPLAPPQADAMELERCVEVLTALETGASDRDQVLAAAEALARRVRRRVVALMDAHPDLLDAEKGGVEALLQCFGVLDDVLNSDASRELFSKLPAAALKVRMGGRLAPAVPWARRKKLWCKPCLTVPM
jgi:hypothetical protein